MLGIIKMYIKKQCGIVETIVCKIIELLLLQINT